MLIDVARTFVWEAHYIKLNRRELLGLGIHQITVASRDIYYTTTYKTTSRLKLDLLRGWHVSATATRLSWHRHINGDSLRMLRNEYRQLR